MSSRDAAAGRLHIAAKEDFEGWGGFVLSCRELDGLDGIGEGRRSNDRRQSACRHKKPQACTLHAVLLIAMVAPLMKLLPEREFELTRFPQY
jgi:hypothetical protein